MTSMIAEAEILKLDTRGRVRTPKERREALLAEFDKSGMSGAAFARMAGIKYATFAQWVAKRRAQKAQVDCSGVVRFVEAEMDSGGDGIRNPVQTPGLVVELPGGSRLRVESAVHVVLAAELIKLVGQNRTKPC